MPSSMRWGMNVLKCPAGGISYGQAPTNVLPPLVAAAAGAVVGAVAGAVVGVAATFTAGSAGFATVVGGTAGPLVAVGATGATPHAARSVEASAPRPIPRISRRRESGTTVVGVRASCEYIADNSSYLSFCVSTTARTDVRRQRRPQR